jgi:pilus assembly protein CpaF
MSTCHANSVVDALRRLETMVLVAGSGLPLDAIREQIGSSIDLVIHVARGNNGCRRIVDVADVDSSPDGWRVHSLIDRTALADARLRP